MSASEELKVGDKVKILSSYNAGFPLIVQPGDVGIIDEIRGDKYQVRVPGASGFFTREQLQKVVENERK